MYIGKIDKISECIDLGKENIALVEEFLKEHDLKSLEVGKYQLNNDSRVLIQEYTTKESIGRKYEAHRKYADIQVLICGEERFGIANQATALGEYDAENDFQLFDGSGEDIILSSDGEVDCAVFMPEELHAPGLCVEKPSPVKKAVFKILISK